MNRTLLCGFAMAILLGPATHAGDCDDDVLPPMTDGAYTCEYRHVPAATFVYSNGQLVVDWAANYVVSDGQIVEDWTRIAPYVPGTAVPFTPDPDAARSAVVGRFTDTGTGESFLGLTPLACRARTPVGELLVLPAGIDWCGSSNPLGCSTSARIVCGDGTVVQAECEGDTTTCSTSCSAAATACCTSSVTQTTTQPGGGTIVVTIQRRVTHACPGGDVPTP